MIEVSAILQAIRTAGLAATGRRQAALDEYLLKLRDGLKNLITYIDKNGELFTDVTPLPQGSKIVVTLANRQQGEMSILLQADYKYARRSYPVGLSIHVTNAEGVADEFFLGSGGGKKFVFTSKQMDKMYALLNEHLRPFLACKPTLKIATTPDLK